MQNGLLLHELLSCFGHLSGLNSIIRMTNGSSISVSDAQIRFERVTEVRPKPSENVEQVSNLQFLFYFINIINIFLYLFNFFLSGAL